MHKKDELFIILSLRRWQLRQFVSHRNFVLPETCIICHNVTLDLLPDLILFIKIKREIKEITAFVIFIRFIFLNHPSKVLVSLKMEVL